MEPISDVKISKLIILTDFFSGVNINSTSELGVCGRGWLLVIFYQIIKYMIDVCVLIILIKYNILLVRGINIIIT